MIKLLLVDDHPLVREGISTMMKDVEWLQIVGSCKTAAETRQFFKSADAEVILLDLNLPDADGTDVCREIRLLNKTVKIIGLTSIDEAGIITRFLQNGGNGYLLKNIERDELLRAIDTVIGGQIYLSQGANEKVVRQLIKKPVTPERPPLTRREREILLLLNDGLNGPTIAERLFLSPFTVETHRKNLMQKLNVHTTQALLNIARNLQIV